jgi:hypothetical protein
MNSDRRRMRRMAALIAAKYALNNLASAANDGDNPLI